MLAWVVEDGLARAVANALEEARKLSSEHTDSLIIINTMYNAYRVHVVRAYRDWVGRVGGESSFMNMLFMRGRRGVIEVPGFLILRIDYWLAERDFDAYEGLLEGVINYLRVRDVYQQVMGLARLYRRVLGDNLDIRFVHGLGGFNGVIVLGY